ncbi:hypothetical protein [Sphingomonas sp. S6]|jgi:hypothetical protein|uniref:hypothetical protein n=1 Tax=Sphingomonas sp. S6 TaxID=3368600 RepID=UPI0028EA2F7E|nr:hypothetical protein [uncultured Sphingomonas sp.]
MTHRDIRIAREAQLTLPRLEANTALNAEAHDALAAFDAFAARRAPVWTGR